MYLNHILFEHKHWDLVYGFSYGTKSHFFASKKGVLQLSLTSDGTLGTYVMINACGVPILCILLLYLLICLLNMVPVSCLVFILILKTLTWYWYLAFGTGLTHLWPVTGVTFHMLKILTMKMINFDKYVDMIESADLIS